MKIRIHRGRLACSIAVLFLFLAYLSACKPLENTTQPILTQVASPLPSRTTTQTYQPTAKPPSVTPSVNPTSTPTLVRSLTPIPTIPPSAIPSYIHDITVNDVGCRLPCWWDIVPEKTTWEEASHFLNSFSEQLGDGFVQNIETENSAITITKYTIQYKLSEQEYGWAIFSVLDGVVLNIEVIPKGLEEIYPLHLLLTKLGTPQSIYISTFSDYGSHGQLEFNVLLVYDNIRASYLFSGEKIGGVIRSCINSQYVEPRLKLGRQIDDSEQISSIGILPIETATGIGIETFTQRYQNPENRQCLETLAELWP